MHFTGLHQNNPKSAGALEFLLLKVGNKNLEGPLENCVLLLRPTRVRLYAQQATTNAAQCQAVPVCLDLCRLLFMYANRMALQIRNVVLILQNIKA